MQRDLPGFAPPNRRRSQSGQVTAACLAQVNERYGLRNEGALPDLLHRAKGPEAKLYESE